MIPLVDASWQGQPWQWQLANAVSDANELTRLLGLEREVVATDFPLLVPRPFLARMRAGDPNDPLLRQVLPIDAENEPAAGYGLDPVGDLNAAATPGLLHKYHGRVLVVVSGACAVNCRYCFRRHFPYDTFQPDKRAWEQIFDYVAANTDITEVILSGGDPLVFPDRRLADIMARLERIGHVTTVRLHTRLPVVIPARVCNEMLTWINRDRLRMVVVIHANHPNEIDSEVASAMKQLDDAGATLLNQSVLLKGVNDDAAVLARLSKRLFECHVMPYYLHQLDRVAGAAHFAVTRERAIELIESLRTELPGYLVPTLAEEIAGAASKRPLA